MSTPKQKSWYRTSTGQLYITSGVTVVFECFGGHQLEFVKILKQTSHAPYPSILQGIVATKGVAGLWDGFLPWGLVQSASKGAVFGWAHSTVTQLVAAPAKEYGVAASLCDTFAGAAAGGVQGLVLSPTLLLKTRVMTDPAFKDATAGSTSALTSSLESCKVGFRLILKEGVPTLFKGAGTFALKRTADWGTRYAFVNAIEVYCFGLGTTRKSLAFKERIAASLAGGFLSAATTIPLDVLVANMQSASSAGKKVSALGAFMEQYKIGGLNHVFGFATRGFVARATHVALTTAVVKTLTSYVTDILEDRAAVDRVR
ncbi:mitochondrial carrier family [Pelagophyceae sp. CCMP2097]|nr:mitochondrial carrier family [Pelagophyceae sp. CCMP2097]|mmetsp:Transcript_15465/g.52155  ORF Transcript_15465/g.52155 Transcript_15465/m.52155 type:complete len:315 (+) Transcript_15465:218-1162(+)